MEQDKQRIFTTYNDQVRTYQETPGFLAEELLIVFGLISTDRDGCLVDAGAHNRCVKNVIEFCPDIDSLLINVARAIVKTSKGCHNPKKQD